MLTRIYDKIASRHSKRMVYGLVQLISYGLSFVFEVGISANKVNKVICPTSPTSPPYCTPEDVNISIFHLSSSRPLCPISTAHYSEELVIPKSRRTPQLIS